MLGKTDPQANFFDSYVEEHFLPQEHELLKMKEKVDFSFIEEETKDLYAEVAGRPSYPPETMFRILFLEFYYNLSDVEVVKQLKFNVLFRYFAAIKIEGPLPDDTSLVVFRKRLGEERFERIFDKFIEQCKKKGLLKERLKAIDATHIIADVAIPNTVNLFKMREEKEFLDNLRKQLNRRRKENWLVLLILKLDSAQRVRRRSSPDTKPMWPKMNLKSLPVSKLSLEMRMKGTELI